MLWVFWLAMLVLLFVQARIATSDEIAIPDAVLRNLEQRMAERGMRFTFGAIHCDSTGHVAVRDLKLYSNQHPDPVFTVDAVRFEINPYALWIHNIAPRTAARIDRASLRLPAMFSSDGTNTAVIDDINAEVEFKSSVLFINGLTARIGNLAIMCRGAAVVPDSRGKPRQAPDVMSDVISAYLKIARQFDPWKSRLDALDNPVLDITLTPNTEHIASARVELTAGSLHLELGAAKGAEPATVLSPTSHSPPNLALGPLIASTTVELGTLFSDAPATAASKESRAPAPPIRIHFSTTEVLFKDNLRALNLRLALTVPLADALRLGDENQAPISAGGATATRALPAINLSLTATIDSLTTRNVTGRAFTARVRGQFPKKLHTDLTARVFDEPVAFETDTDLEEKTAEAGIITRVSPRHIAALSRELKYDVGTILKPARPIGIEAKTRLSPGWNFTGAEGSLDIGPIIARNVSVDRARGNFTYDHAKREILFSPAQAAIGDSFAHGSFGMNFVSLEYRFLLAGRLRPRSIDGWLGKWWPVFWNNFTFGGPAAFGDVDVQGNFRHTDTTRVFVFANANTLTYNTVAFDHALLTLFVRPDYFDALDLFARRGGGYARGTFTHQRLDPDDRHLLTVLDFKAENIDPSAVAPAISPAIATGLADLHFEKPLEHLKVGGRIDGPASPRGQHVLLDISAEGSAGFTYQHTPFTSLATSLHIRDDIVNMEHLETQFADGHLAIKAQVSGTGAARKLGFDMNLNRANFGQVSQLIEEGSARKRGVAPKPTAAIHKQPPGALLDLRLSADGLLGDEFSFKGNGSAEITGAELVNVNVFGSLSQALREVKVLNFTTLSLNNGQVNFTLDERRVIIPEAVLTGQKAHVKLSGEYTLDSRFANFTAKIYPLSESRGILGKGLGFLLVPITHLTELKLTGSIDAPKWRFSYGPTSFFRALAGKSSDTESLEQEHAPAPVASGTETVETPSQPEPAPEKPTMTPAKQNHTVPETLRRPTTNKD